MNDGHKDCESAKRGVMPETWGEEFDVDLHSSHWGARGQRPVEMLRSKGWLSAAAAAAAAAAPQPQLKNHNKIAK
jgi:hypothetical protein